MSDPKRAEELFAQGCRSRTEVGRLRACVYLAELVVDGTSRALPLDAARKQAEEACSADEAGGCLVFGKYRLRHERDIDAARPLFKKACELGEKSGCVVVDRLERQGR